MIKRTVFYIAALLIPGGLLAEGDLVPLDQIRPLDAAVQSRHQRNFDYGLSATNTYIADTAFIKKGEFLGNYRPFFRFLWNDNKLLNARARLDYAYNNSLTDAQAAVGQKTSTGFYALELLNAELVSGVHKLTVGRAYYSVGRGLLLANFADGLQYEGQFSFAKITALAAYSAQYSGCAASLAGCGFSGQIMQKSPYDVTPGRTIDSNLPDTGKRIFSALTVQSPQVKGTSAYALAMYSYDFNQSVIPITDGNAGKAAGQQYTFQPLYAGLGLSGYVSTPRLRYLAEGIYETGTTYNRVNLFTSSSAKSTIQAWAATLDLNYALPYAEALLKPGVIFQYATGSGRQAKIGSGANPANPSQENETGNDTNFFYFGFYSAGLALKPKLSNLHVFRAGVQFRPLHHFHWGRNLMTVFKYSYYHKQNADNVISDPNAVVAKASVGHGLDAQFVYDVSSDFKLFYAYGVFLPGAAYLPTAETVQIHVLSFNLVF
jgi:hypothetical protein